jgi:hypothetical protein
MRFNKRNELRRPHRQWSWNWYAGGDEEPLHRPAILLKEILNARNHPKSSIIRHAIACWQTCPAINILPAAMLF